jgi:hypothetical protein
VRAARQLYGQHWRTTVPIGLSALVLVGAVRGLAALIAGQRGVDSATGRAGAHLAFADTIESLGQPIAGALGRTLLYFDLGVRAEEEPAKPWRERLPRRPAAAGLELELRRDQADQGGDNARRRQEEGPLHGVETCVHFSAQSSQFRIDPIETAGHISAQFADIRIDSTKALIHAMAEIVHPLIGPAISHRLHASIVPRPTATVAR